jgi:hypothetical protein
MLNKDPNTRSSADSCIQFIIDHHKRLVRPWVHRNGRRKARVSVCISALLDYGLVSFEQRRTLLIKLAQHEDAFEIPYAHARQEPGVYVGVEAAVAVTHEQLPRLSHALEELVDETARIVEEKKTSAYLPASMEFLLRTPVLVLVEA